MTNIESQEEILVGTIFLYPEKYPEAAGIVRPIDFIGSYAMRVWAKIGDEFAGGKSDLQARVAIAMGSKEDFSWVIGVTSDIIPTPSSVLKIARTIADAAKRRRIRLDLLSIADKSIQSGARSDWILEDIMSAYRREVGASDTDARIVSVLSRFATVQQENAANGGLGMRTGFSLLQDDFIVYQRGHLWVIGAWTSGGKSAYMIESVIRFFNENKNGVAAIFSTEMMEEQNVARILANKTGLHAGVILSGLMMDSHKKRVKVDEEWLASTNLFIYDKLRNIDDVMAQCRKLKYTSGLDIIFLDFIQNVFRPNGGEQYSMMSQIAKDLQALAHDLGITIVCLSQLPNHAGREDSGILEFKGAGEIAAACDIGVLMKRAKDDKTKLLFDVRKNRHGKCEKYIMQFADNYTRIEEIGVAEEQK